MKSAAKQPLTDEQQTFIQEFASLLAPWGLPPSAGRVYGYLLLHKKPVPLDQIAADLAMSKAGTWSVAKDMEAFGHLRRYSEPGSKRALYAASDNFALPMAKQAALLGEMSALIEGCASTIAGGEVVAPLQERAQFYQSIQTAMTATIDELNAKRQRGTD